MTRQRCVDFFFQYLCTFAPNNLKSIKKHQKNASNSIMFPFLLERISTRIPSHSSIHYQWQVIVIRNSGFSVQNFFRSLVILDVNLGP